MATIKSYTDISQSKTLSKILPLESADMGYLWNGTSFCEYPVSKQTIFKRVENIPCWSLAALLSVLPYPHIEQNYKGKWTCRVEHRNTTYLWEDSNLIDACVAMVKKLNDLNLL